MHKYIYIYIYTYTHTYTYIYIFYKGRLCVWHEPKKARPSKFRAIRKQNPAPLPSSLPHTRTKQHQHVNLEFLEFDNDMNYF